MSIKENVRVELKGTHNVDIAKIFEGDNAEEV